MKLPFNIAYLDVNDELVEDVSMSPSKYGGGRVVSASFLDTFDNFHIYANEKCFENVREDKKSQCFVLSDEDRKYLRNGENLLDVISIYMSDYDLILHHFSNININIGVPTLVWPVGYSEPIHPLNKHIALFDKNNQSPRFFSNDHVIYDVVIGPRMPEFQEYKKEDFIFCCGRLTPTYQSIQIAQLARKYEIPVVFSGPIDRDYPFLDYLSDYASYLGVIDHATKMEYNRRAKMTAQLMNYPISVTLSMKEAAAVGVGCLATPVGQYRSWLKEGVNGYFVRSEQDFVSGWEKRDLLLQKNCYNNVLQFSENKMIEMFLQAFEAIIENG
jgi:glycosyltransferase involved in cell wall biosynthesis